MHQSYSQYYHALNGSSHAGANSIFNNPASPNNCLYQWDLTLFSGQLLSSSNTLFIKNMQLPNFGNALMGISEGTQKRNINTSLDFSLLNAMYQINKKQTVSLGLRMRMNNHIQTSSFEINDSSNSLNQFLINNRNTAQIEGKVTSVGWLEGNLNYSQVITENKKGRLSAGITLQIQKSILGAFARASRVSYLETIRTNDTIYSLSGGLGSFGYSANLDTWSANISTEGNINTIIKNSKSSIGLSAGIEYLLYRQDEDIAENIPRNYQWKLGLSLMDIGSNQFNTSKFTGQFYTLSPTITDEDITDKITTTGNVGALRDSLNQLLGTITPLAPSFSISNPTRIILNADRNLGNNFYLNGQISIPLSNNNTRMSTNDLNFISLTPRWETRIWGIYLPVQYTSNRQFWGGIAVKTGPVILGFHHIGLLRKDPLLNGGGYLILNIHPFAKKEIKSRLDCFK